MSDLVEQAELDDLRATVRDFLVSRSNEEEVNRLVTDDAPYDGQLWATMADELGLQSLAISEEHGGDGFSFVELGVVLQEMGRALTPSPFLATVVMAGTALAEVGGDVATQELPAIASGKRTATFAVAEADGSWSTDNLTTTARQDQQGWLLTGEKPIVLDGATAELLLVVAATKAGPTLFAVDADAAGLTRTPLQTLDPTRKLARLTFDDVPARLLGEEGAAASLTARVLDLTATALAAEQVGAAEACVARSTAYARERQQFGRAIGSFQAIKHKCADMLARTQIARAAADEAAFAATGHPEAPPLGVASAVAHIVCSEAAMFVAAEQIQVHGGIGFTWEHPAHLYYRRAKAAQQLLGGPAVYHERLLERLGV